MNWFEFQLKRSGLTTKDLSYKAWTSEASVIHAKGGQTKKDTLKQLVKALSLSEIEKEIIYAERGFFTSPNPAITKMAALIVIGMEMGWLERVDYGEKYSRDAKNASLLQQITQKFEGRIE